MEEQMHGLNDWLTDRPTKLLTNWPTDRLTDQTTDESIDWLTDQLTDQPLTDWPTNLLIDRSTYQSFCLYELNMACQFIWLERLSQIQCLWVWITWANQPTNWPMEDQMHRLTNQPTNRLTNQPTDWLINWLTNHQPTEQTTDQPTNQLTDRPTYLSFCLYELNMACQFIWLERLSQFYCLWVWITLGPAFYAYFQKVFNEEYQLNYVNVSSFHYTHDGQNESKKTE